MLACMSVCVGVCVCYCVHDFLCVTLFAETLIKDVCVGVLVSKSLSVCCCRALWTKSQLHRCWSTN